MVRAASAASQRAPCPYFCCSCSSRVLRCVRFSDDRERFNDTVVGTNVTGACVRRCTFQRHTLQSLCRARARRFYTRIRCAVSNDYRARFHCSGPVRTRTHVSADERVCRTKAIAQRAFHTGVSSVFVGASGGGGRVISPEPRPGRRRVVRRPYERRRSVQYLCVARRAYVHMGGLIICMYSYTCTEAQARLNASTYVLRITLHYPTTIIRIPRTGSSVCP